MCTTEYMVWLNDALLCSIFLLWSIKYLSVQPLIQTKCPLSAPLDGSDVLVISPVLSLSTVM